MQLYSTVENNPSSLLKIVELLCSKLSCPFLYTYKASMVAMVQTLMIIFPSSLATSQTALRKDLTMYLHTVGGKQVPVSFSAIKDLPVRHTHTHTHSPCLLGTSRMFSSPSKNLCASQEGPPLLMLADLESIHSQTPTLRTTVRESLLSPCVCTRGRQITVCGWKGLTHLPQRNFSESPQRTL